MATKLIRDLLATDLNHSGIRTNSRYGDFSCLILYRHIPSISEAADNKLRRLWPIDSSCEDSIDSSFGE
jgi:hypothetical protein